MKKQQVIIIPLAALLLTACSSSDDIQTAPAEERVELVITSNIGLAETSSTRASGVTWASGDQIGVFATPAGSTTSVIRGGSNVLYSTTVTDATASGSSPNYTYVPAMFTATAPIYLPANGDAIDVYAYYPYQAGSESNPINATAIAIDVSDQSDQAAIDFMRAYNNKTTIDGSTAITKTNKQTELLFYHKLTKVVFTLTAGTGMQGTDFSAVTTTLTIGGQPTAATYNIYTNEISITAGTTSITAHTVENGVTYDAILLPNGTGNTATDRTCTLTVGDAAYTFTIPESKVLTAGEQTNYTLTVNASGLTVSASIEPWSSTNMGQVTAVHTTN